MELTAGTLMPGQLATFNSEGIIEDSQVCWKHWCRTRKQQRGEAAHSGNHIPCQLDNRIAGAALIALPGATLQEPPVDTQITVSDSI